MFCIYCGKKLIDRARFCTFCGGKVVMTNEQIEDNAGIEKEQCLTNHSQEYTPAELYVLGMRKEANGDKLGALDLFKEAAERGHAAAKVKIKKAYGINVVERQQEQSMADLMREVTANFEKKQKNPNNATEIAGTVYGNVSDAITISGETMFVASRGHGFAAERANTLYDIATGNDATILGDDNKINGADRVVNGVNIQSKYCSSGSKCVGECFDKNGKFRYINPDGSPMQIEVPSDKYNDAVKAMEERIRRGEIPGVKDPQKAKEIIRKGHFTYEQSKNIAKFGTVESLTYDAVNGAIVGASTFGITSMMTFAVSVWKGENFETALNNAITSGIQVGGMAFVTSIVAGQLTKAGAYGVVSNMSGEIVKLMGPKASAVLANAFRSGKDIYGAAAMKSAQKLFASNIITGVASVVVLSTFDVVNIFRGRISGAQLCKNLINTGASVAGGTAGWAAGASAGATLGSIVPGVGNVVGGIIGGLFGAFCGGNAANTVSSTIMDEFIEDDANKMVAIIENEFKDIAIDYLLNQSEAEKAVGLLSGDIDGSTLKDMYASHNRKNFARNLILPNVETVVKKRKHIVLPNQDAMVRGLRRVLETIADEQGIALEKV